MIPTCAGDGPPKHILCGMVSVSCALLNIVQLFSPPGVFGWSLAPVELECPRSVIRETPTPLVGWHRFVSSLRTHEAMWWSMIIVMDNLCQTYKVWTNLTGAQGVNKPGEARNRPRMSLDSTWDGLFNGHLSCSQSQREDLDKLRISAAQPQAALFTLRITARCKMRICARARTQVLQRPRPHTRSYCFIMFHMFHIVPNCSKLFHIVEKYARH